MDAPLATLLELEVLDGIGDIAVAARDACLGQHAVERPVGARLLGVGGSKDPLEAYRDFRGRDKDVAPLLKRRGLSGA